MARSSSVGTRSSGPVAGLRFRVYGCRCACFAVNAFPILVDDKLSSLRDFSCIYCMLNPSSYIIVSESFQASCLVNKTLDAMPVEIRQASPISQPRRRQLREGLCCTVIDGIYSFL